MQRRRTWRYVELRVYVHNILPGVVVQVIDVDVFMPAMVTLQLRANDRRAHHEERSHCLTTHDLKRTPR